MSAFDKAFQVVVGAEGGFQADPGDPGNWTGGRAGAGECRGTNWGISARAYPTLDIRGLAEADAQAIYKRDYWDRVGGDGLPGPLALLVFDAAVQCGVTQAAKWLQEAVGAVADGEVGPATLAAVQSHGGTGAALCSEVLARRVAFMGGLPTWSRFGLGWSRRLMALPFAALTMGEAA